MGKILSNTKISTTNDHGAIIKQDYNNPGAIITQTPAQIKVDGTIESTGGSIKGSSGVITNTLSVGSLSSGGTVSGSGIVGSTETISGASTAASYTATGTVQGATVNATSKAQLNGVTILESGTTFPSSSLVDGQRYRHQTYKSWFVYNSTDTKWRQESPGVFSGSFPTVASGDNTVAPNMEVKRLDLNNRIYFWDGSVWNPIAGTVVNLSQVCRILDDSTSRASPYTNNAVQVTGVTDIRAGTFTMPTNVKAVWYSVILLTAAAGTVVSLQVENPDALDGALTLSGATVNNTAIISFTGGGMVTLSSLGKLSIVYRGSANVTRTIIDIRGYIT